MRHFSFEFHFCVYIRCGKIGLAGKGIVVVTKHYTARLTFVISHSYVWYAGGALVQLGKYKKIHAVD